MKDDQRISEYVTCSKCGRDNPAGATFCAYCGNGLKQNKKRVWLYALLLCFVIVIVIVAGLVIANRIGLVNLPFLDRFGFAQATIESSQNNASLLPNNSISTNKSSSTKTDVSKPSPTPKPTARPTSTPKPTAIPPEEEHIYEFYSNKEDMYSEVVFDVSEQRYVFIANLLECYGTICGTYTEDSSGTIRCAIEGKDFAGFTREDFDAFHLYRSGDTISISTEIWNLYPDSCMFTLDYTLEYTPMDKVGTISGEGVRLRTRPNTDSIIITEYSRGTQVNLLGKCGDWYMIKYSWDGWVEGGFVSADYISY